MEEHKDSLDKAMEKIRKSQEKMFRKREEFLRMRNHRKAILEEKVKESRQHIRNRQMLTQQQVESGSIHDRATDRVTKGLRELERFAEGLVDDIVAPSRPEEMRLNPEVATAIKEKAQEIIETPFFQSLITQIEQMEITA